MKFFHFSQNNSGGSFDFSKSEGITHHVVVEAEDADSANAKAETIGIYFDGCEDERDCPCCGDRWSQVCESDGFPFPHVYGAKLGEKFEELRHGWMEDGHEIAVHFSDGNVKWFNEDYTENSK